MIRINLLKPLQSPVRTERSTTLVQEPPKGGKKFLIWLLIFLFAGIGVYLALINSKPTPPAPVAVTVAQEPAAPIGAPAPKPAPVADTVAGANAAPIAHLLRDLLAATTPGVGFSKIEFSAPGEFQVHGVASTEADLNHFQNALDAAAGISFKTDRVVPVGADKSAREFLFSGDVNYPVAKGDSLIHTIPANQMSEALQDFASAAKQQNIDIEKPPLKDSSLFRGIRSFHYNTDARCDYSDLQTLLEKLPVNHSSIAFRHLTLEARGDDKMAATFDLVLYAQ